jgi:hypothetical protein
MTRARLGPGTVGKGKGTGSGAMTDEENIPDNMALSNRDKSRHSHDRGQDSKWIETEQRPDHAANRLDDNDEQ